MGDILPGFSFSGNAPNNVVTAANLNALVGSAAVQPSLISGKPVKALPVNADALLLWDSVSQALQQVTVQDLVPTYSARSGFSGLTIANAGGASPVELVATATELVMLTAAGVPRRVKNFSATVATNVAIGLGGPDASGIPAHNQWLYVYAISDGTTDGLILTANTAGPALPTGFIYSRILGAWHCDGSSNLVPQAQQNLSVIRTMGPPATDTTASNQVPFLGTVGSGTQLSSPATGASGPSLPVTWSSIDLSLCCPPGITSRVQGIVGTTDSGGTNHLYGLASEAVTSDNAFTANPYTAPTMGLQFVRTIGGATVLYGFTAYASFDIGIGFTATPVMYAACDAASNVKYQAMRITGFTLNL